MRFCAAAALPRPFDRWVGSAHGRSDRDSIVVIDRAWKHGGPVYYYYPHFCYYYCYNYYYHYLYYYYYHTGITTHSCLLLDVVAVVVVDVALSGWLAFRALALSVCVLRLSRVVQFCMIRTLIVERHVPLNHPTNS